ncbi:hypothetical protein ABVN80_03160 [Acinetobacter baumannii]
MSGKHINSASALWTRNKSEVTEEQYVEFYKKLNSRFLKLRLHGHITV